MADAFPLVAIASYPDWHPGVPAGKVRVIATAGGDAGRDAARRIFHIDAVEFEAAAKPFVVDPDKHKEVTRP